MEIGEIKKFHQALHNAMDSPNQVALVQIELAGQAGYISNSLKILRNMKPEFFISKKKEKDPVTGKPYSNEFIEMLWLNGDGKKEIELKSDIEILDRFLSAAKAAMIALTIESRVQE